MSVKTTSCTQACHLVTLLLRTVTSLQVTLSGTYVVSRIRGTHSPSKQVHTCRHAAVESVVEVHIEVHMTLPRTLAATSRSAAVRDLASHKS